MSPTTMSLRVAMVFEETLFAPKLDDGGMALG